MDDKENREALDQYIQKRFNSRRTFPESHKKKRFRNSAVIIVNAILLVFMIYLYRTQDAGPHYYSKTVTRMNASYRFAVSTAADGAITAGLTVRHSGATGAPITFLSGVADISVTHKNTELVRQPLMPEGGSFRIDPGKSKSIAIKIDGSPILLFAKTEGLSDKSPTNILSLFDKTKTVSLPLSAEMRVRGADPVTISIDFNYEAAK